MIEAEAAQIRKQIEDKIDRYILERRVLVLPAMVPRVANREEDNFSSRRRTSGQRFFEDAWLLEVAAGKGRGVAELWWRHEEERIAGRLRSAARCAKHFR